MLNSPKRSIRQKNKRLAKLDLKNDADTDPVLFIKTHAF